MQNSVEDSFSALLTEYRYWNPDTENEVQKPTYGTNGWLTHTYQEKYSGSASKEYLQATYKQHMVGGGTYEYLGPVGNSANNLFGANYGNKNGIGIVDLVENRLVGLKSRGIYENPGGAIIMYAHRELEYLTLDRATYHFKEHVANKYAELVYDGMWFSPLREALAAFVDETQKTCSGTVKLKLYKGNIISAGSSSPYSLYSEEYVTFGEDDVYDQKDAGGFINLFGLPLTMRALMMQKNEKKNK